MSVTAEFEKSFVKRVVTFVSAFTMLVILAALSTPTQAQTLTTLHTFGPAVNGEGTGPSGGVIRDKAGNLYGTTDWGGDLTCNAPFGCGTVFMVDPSGNETVLHTFSGPSNIGALYPLDRVGVRDSAGNLYGTTQNYGGSPNGTVFKMDKAGHVTLLHKFTGPPDGGWPQASVIRDSTGNIYGTTVFGGKNQTCNGWAPGCGSVFKIDTKGHETVLYSFTGGQDGWYPGSVLSQDAAGNLYGTTYFGGTYNLGTVFKIDKTGKETTLHTFAGGVDGEYSVWPVIQCGTGLLCGTAKYGGIYGEGVAFKLDQTRAETVIYSFAAGNNGAQVSSGLIRDSAGNLYGETDWGGIYNNGTLFKIDSTGQETVLYNFTGGTDGGFPVGGLIRDTNGNIYGTTAGGGDPTCACGTVFKLVP